MISLLAREIYQESNSLSNKSYNRMKIYKTFKQVHLMLYENAITIKRQRTCPKRIMDLPKSEMKTIRFQSKNQTNSNPWTKTSSNKRRKICTRVWMNHVSRISSLIFIKMILKHQNKLRNSPLKKPTLKQNSKTRKHPLHFTHKTSKFSYF